MIKVEFNAAFRTDKAGRAANQDNGFCILDLTAPDGPADKNLNTDRTIRLGDAGALFVVADGMGGMNAGEKASELIVNGVRESFSNIPAGVVGNLDAMKSFMLKAIAKADNDVKNYAAMNPETRGMGSTIVALWLYGNQAIAAWVGDSRIYRFNPANGIVRLSHDHSYVQSLVDTGRLSEELAFDHPDSNIITRSLGDNNEAAKTEIRVYKVYDGDEFLLCSDGLCGLLQDDETEAIMQAHEGSSLSTLQALWQEGEKKGWSDNATIEVVCVTGDLPAAKKNIKDGYPSPKASPNRSTSRMPQAMPSLNLDAPPAYGAPKKSKFSFGLFLGILIAAIAVGCGVFFWFQKSENPSSAATIDLVDSEEDGDDDSGSPLAAQIRELTQKQISLDNELKGVKGDLTALSSQEKADISRQLAKLKSDCEDLINSTTELSSQQMKKINSILEFARKQENMIANIPAIMERQRQAPNPTRAPQTQTQKPEGKKPPKEKVQEQQPAPAPGTTNPEKPPVNPQPTVGPNKPS